MYWFNLHHSKKEISALLSDSVIKLHAVIWSDSARKHWFFTVLSYLFYSWCTAVVFPLYLQQCFNTAHCSNDKKRSTIRDALVSLVLQTNCKCVEKNLFILISVSQIWALVEMPGNVSLWLGVVCASGRPQLWWSKHMQVLILHSASLVWHHIVMGFSRESSAENVSLSGEVSPAFIALLK